MLSTGGNSKEVAYLAWNMLIMCSPALLEKTSWKKMSSTWWNNLAWSLSSQFPQLTRNTLYQLSWSHRLSNSVRWNHHQMIHVHCISSLSMALSLMVFSCSLSRDPFIGVQRHGPRINPPCTKMEHGSSLEKIFMILSSYAKQDLWR